MANAMSGGSKKTSPLKKQPMSYLEKKGAKEFEELRKKGAAKMRGKK